MRVLFVHQSAELYGSDRTLLTLVERLHAQDVECIVLLPSTGPLEHALTTLGVETHVGPVGKLTRSSLSAAGMPRFTREMAACLRHIDRVVGDRKIDLIHSNTLAVLGGAWWAKRRRVPHLWHVHELVVHPKVAVKTFPWLLRGLADRVVCNSTLTRDWLVREQPTLAERSVTVWNGIAEVRVVSAEERIEARNALNAETSDLLITLVGRINRLKGQELLVEAVEILWHKGLRNLRVAMIGGPPPGQMHHLHALTSRIDQSPARTVLQIMSFVDDLAPIWAATDIGVVPSTEPESFGLVAIEAMRAGKPVVAAGHGGVLDIVQNEETGLLFAPGDGVALAHALLALAIDKARRERMGRRGRERQTQLFTLDAHVTAMRLQYESLMQLHPESPK